MNVKPLLITALLLTGACANTTAPSQPTAQRAANWRRTITTSDLARLRNWRQAMVEALAAARGAVFDEAIAREAVLLDPDAALPSALPPAGAYRCRTIKLGDSDARAGSYNVFAPQRCAITHDADTITLNMIDGIQRPAGRLFREDDKRLIFLGTLMLGDEARALEYARDSRRDMAGALERIGDQRWRLLLPTPAFESKFDVIELVPAG